jgi:hypothetical protein
MRSQNLNRKMACGYRYHASNRILRDISAVLVHVFDNLR